MKKLIMIMLVAVGMNLFADEWHDESTGFTWYYTISGDSATLTGCSPKEGKLPPLPSILGDKSVTIIGQSAFDGCRGFSGRLVLPDSLMEIKAYAFRDCSGLTGSFTIPDNVVTIAYGSFDGCSGFTGSLRIPDKVMTIGGEAFAGCSGFTGSLTISSKVTEIAHEVFSGCSGFTGTLTIPDSVTTIWSSAFSGCSGFTELVISDSVTYIAINAFIGCSGFTGTLTIPSSVTKIGNDAFYRCSGITAITFLGLPPNGWDKVGLSISQTVPEKFAAEWKKVLAHKNLREPMREGVPVAKVISAKMRESDPTIMDVVYKVTSAKPTVKVRALAFQDGERSFAKVVRPETFVEDENGNPTAGNIGDGVTANEEHTLSWKVSADWNATLAKVKFEVLAVEDEILPLELVTLPKTETQPKMVFSWNYVIPSRAFDALLWLYADKDLGLTLTDGVLKNGDVRLADGASCDKTSYDALVYIYGKMGYELLQGERLDYVRERSRLDLPGISERQYAVKVIEE